MQRWCIVDYVRPMRLSVLDQSPISEGSTGARRAREHDRPRPARRRPRLPPLLGGRAPRRADARRARARGADRPDRGGDRAHPRRQRRRDAAALQPAQGRRELQPARRPVPGPDRPRHRARRRHRPDDDATRSSATAARPRRTTSPSSSPSCSPTSRTRCPPTTRSRALGRSLPGLPEAPEPWLLGSSPQSAIWAAQLGLPYAFADFINRDGAAIATDYQRRFDPACGWPPRVPRSRLGARAPRPRRRPGGSTASAGWRWRCCAAAA